jgi:hypothetical protein
MEFVCLFVVIIITEPASYWLQTEPSFAQRRRLNCVDFRTLSIVKAVKRNGKCCRKVLSCSF